jgi:putative NADH-flavin reductase
MMNIVVFGAGGKAGRRITAEAARRGHHVIAVARERSQLTDLPAGVVPEVGDPTSSVSVRKLAEGTDAFIVAIGGTDNSLWKRAAQTLTDTLNGMAGKIPRILHMGGGASLLTADGARFLDLPGFPKAFRGPAEGQAAALDFYRQLADPKVSWTYVSPPPVNFSPGQRTGRYRTGKDHPVVDEKGDSVVSYEDYAVALIDEVENQRFVNTRFTVGY